MTTTAEKIKVMQAFEDGEAIEGCHFGKNNWFACSCPSWDWSAYEYRIKPTDPEPLECWANQPHSNGRCEFFNSPSEAMERVNSHKSFRRAVYMREVTPQDEQDREDAARYRWLKSKARSFERNPPLFWQPVEKWDEKIDKAIEGRIKPAEPENVLSHQKCLRMREVIPQDEQDRRDAARYRWLIENGYNNFQVLWNNIPEWSAIIDKAMEQT